MNFFAHIWCVWKFLKTIFTIYSSWWLVTMCESISCDQNSTALQHILVLVLKYFYKYVYFTYGVSPYHRKSSCICTCTKEIFKVLVLYLSTLKSTWPHACFITFCIWLPVSYSLYMLNMHVIVVPIKVNMDACMCEINFVITIELTATSPAEWLLA